MNNKPVAWMDKYNAVIPVSLKYFQPELFKDYNIPLYTHPAKELNAGGEPVKNATYWKRQYNEMSALNDRLKSSLYHANEQIKYLESHPAKTLTDEEIFLEIRNGGFNAKIGFFGGQPLLENCTDIEFMSSRGFIDCVRAILRKAQEK